MAQQSVDFSSLFKPRASATSSTKPGAACTTRLGKSKSKKPASGPTTAAVSKQKAHVATKSQPKPAKQPGSAAHESTMGGGSKRRRKREAKRQAEATGGSALTQPPAPKRPKGTGGLQSKLEAQLAGAQFRHINEQLYTRDSSDAQQLFQEEPALFEAYHEGFRSQAERWPQRPVDEFIAWLAEQPRDWVVGDMGCGDAEIGARARQRVLSFDLLETNERVTACDIAQLPLADGFLHVAIFCLSLMGANYEQFLREAHRTLCPQGVLKVAEVKSRFADVDAWVKMLRRIGFDLVERRDDNSHFIYFEFVKSARSSKDQLQHIPLKPCIYKRR